MRIDIFDVEGGKVKINDYCLTIPELKAVVEQYDNAISALCFLYYMYDPFSPYRNLPEEEREEVLLKDYPGDYTTEDEVIIEASEKLKSLYMTPTYRYYLDNKALLEKLGSFARTTQITSGRDGNHTSSLAQIKSVGNTIIEFKRLEKIVDEELQESKRIKGGRFKAYDQ